MTFEVLKEKIGHYQKEGIKYFTTSSFQSHSLVLLHMLSRVDKDIPVYFINTGYHFPETVAFRDKIMADFGLKNLVDLKPLTPKNMQRGADGKMFFTSDPDYCCYLNKTQPMDMVLMQHDVWINGVRADQSKTRSAMKVEQAAPHDTTRLHPMLDWSSKMVHDYRKEYRLPDHPLEAKGYFSIGCEPCTRKFDLDMQERESRWYGMNKTECGLHTDLVK
ncbi:phosphoadenylyl-sulfate reductase [Marivirga sp. S37H4]|uniref:Adenosine 5'-phosphosulfate reductase n=1 Tax=Marivirga aurantiaca TaxID=2802615 RepID=A0A935C4R6_9BACT|nr:phosphoadenylyl-sulfate reductase [Marivirga aurantiaca]MBK6263439.1 phosphoadenylyl-sulfate reductase [Marivirga aurantiaca]